MKAKLALLVGAAAGYVLGTRAGRERYDQIKGTASDLWQNDRLQERVSGAETFVTSKAPDMQQKVTDAAKSAVGAARTKFGRAEDEDPFADPSLTNTDRAR